MLALFFVISVNSAHASTWDEVNERLAACNAEAPPPGQSCSCYKNIILQNTLTTTVEVRKKCDDKTLKRYQDRYYLAGAYVMTAPCPTCSTCNKCDLTNYPVAANCGGALYEGFHKVVDIYCDGRTEVYVYKHNPDLLTEAGCGLYGHNIVNNCTSSDSFVDTYVVSNCRADDPCCGDLCCGDPTCGQGSCGVSGPGFSSSSYGISLFSLQ